MIDAPLRTGLQDVPAEMADWLVPVLDFVCGSLKLEELLEEVLVRADDFPGDDDAWFGIVPGPAPSQKLRLTLHCHLASFCRPRPATSTVFPERAVWEQSAAPISSDGPEPGDWSEARSEMFLYHQLLTARDVIEGRLLDLDLPASLAEAFNSAWAVVVDGRLERRGLPGYPMAERRARFSRLFSSGGILMPDHWNIFQALWDGGLQTPREVKRVLRQLPRLT